MFSLGFRLLRRAQPDTPPQIGEEELFPDRSPQVEHILSLFKNKSGLKQLLNLEPDQAQNYADILDESLNDKTAHDQTRTRHLKCLRWLCGTFGILPSSFILTDTFDRHGSTPFATGGFSHVYHATFRGRPVAIKSLVFNTVRKENLQKTHKLLAREVVGWRWLQHKNILSFVGVTPELAIVSDLMEHGNVMDFIGNHPRHNRFRLLHGAATGLEYLHSRGIVHGDLKGANILIDSGRSARLADFGLTTIIEESTLGPTTGSGEIRGTTRWMAPEMLLPEEYGFSNDLRRRLPSTGTDTYALGMTVLEVLTGKRPFNDIKKVETVMLEVMRGKKPDRPPSGFSDALWDLLLVAWDEEYASQPPKRPSVRMILDQLKRDGGKWGKFIILPAPEQGDDSRLPRNSELVGCTAPEVLADTTVAQDVMLDAGPISRSRHSVSTVVPDTPKATDQAPPEAPPRPDRPAWGATRQQPRGTRTRGRPPSPPEPEAPPRPSWTIWNPGSTTRHTPPPPESAPAPSLPSWTEWGRKPLKHEPLDRERLERDWLEHEWLERQQWGHERFESEQLEREWLERYQLEHELLEHYRLEHERRSGGPPGPPEDELPPDAPPPPPSPARPAWRTVQPRPRKRREGFIDPPPPEPESGESPGPPQDMPRPPSPSRPVWRSVRQQPRERKTKEPPSEPEPRPPASSWARWEPDTRYVPTPPTPEPQLFIPPRGSPGLFGPRSPRDSLHE